MSCSSIRCEASGHGLVDSLPCSCRPRLALQCGNSPRSCFRLCHSRREAASSPWILGDLCRSPIACGQVMQGARFCLRSGPRAEATRRRCKRRSRFQALNRRTHWLHCARLEPLRMAACWCPSPVKPKTNIVQYCESNAQGCVFRTTFRASACRNRPNAAGVAQHWLSQGHRWPKVRQAWSNLIEFGQMQKFLRGAIVGRLVMLTPWGDGHDVRRRPEMQTHCLWSQRRSSLNP